MRRQLWQELTELPDHHNDLRLRLMLFDLAMMANDGPAMDRCLADIRAVEGTQGDFHHLGSVKEIWLGCEGKADAKAALTEVRLQLDQVAMPWPRVSLARADIAERTGNGEEAIVHLKKAIDLGETSPKVIQRLVDALIQRQQYAEADHEMQRLRDAPGAARRVAPSAAIIAMHMGKQQERWN